MTLTHFSWWPKRLFAVIGATALMLLLIGGSAAAQESVSPQAVPGPIGPPVVNFCQRTIFADVVAFDQPFFWNRLGAVQPQGMIYALRRDVVPREGSSLYPGNVKLRDGKRPRPLVLRMNIGDCLEIRFENLLAHEPRDEEQPHTRTASIHVVGMQIVNTIRDDGSNVGANPTSFSRPGGLVRPGRSITYKLYAEKEGTHLMHSAAAMTGGEGDGGSIPPGLFGAINVLPAQSEWYRSQVTAAEMQMITLPPPPGAESRERYNYQKLYEPPHPRAGLPVLKMLHNNEIVHSDLNAIITGPNAGRFATGTYPPNPSLPDRDQPFREFTIIYHDEIGAVQAFPEFNQPQLEYTLHSVRDAFAINYGSGGIGAEILANRFGVGPMHDCNECLYEEFFLSAWTVGDPAMVVDRPANAPCTIDDIREGRPCLTERGPKATRAFFPDDPSNVYHSYLNEHVKFRILHAGPKEHHIHHQHAHQWFFTPNSPDSTALDSQAIGPGSDYTLEILQGGSGNRNRTVGDSIFHCHFYPHFAMGMWGMWRVHDVFEKGTPLDGDGRPVVGSRALPDGEIVRGTPIPGIVPVPTIPMAPLPQAQVEIVQKPGLPGGQVKVTPIPGTIGNPGFPFFVPGVAGHRVPQPPLDLIDDGGLPRHIITDGLSEEHHTRLDFSKEILTANAQVVPQDGTRDEKAAMTFHEQSGFSSFTPEGAPGRFVTNGAPRKPGAPYADPCISTGGTAIRFLPPYKVANIQIDLKFNKAGWHHPQARISALWHDVAAIRNNTKPPEPLFFRANSNDCVEFRHTNLVPKLYKVDDFQVTTPTDIMGQHIHLVKFDVTSSDGAANGFNYEDGVFSPEEVVARIEAINGPPFNGILSADGTTRTQLTPRPHPFFGTLGAQTGVQRWFADRVTNGQNVDRTLRTAFTHDHFGPSTHQQTGLYAGLVIEPEFSSWFHNETGAPLGFIRDDMGPTSWQAIIKTQVLEESYREFLIEFADFTIAYKKNGGGTVENPIPDPPNAINPPGREEIGLPFLLKRPERCPISNEPPPCPEAISADDSGTFTVNYRNEPIPFRVRNPNTNQQAHPLSTAFQSGITRSDPDFNVQPNFYPPLTKDMRPTDPFTPLMRTFINDRIQVRILVGAHEEGHNFSVHGLKWLFEPDFKNSGFKSSQMMGISEHFEFVIPPLPKHGLGNSTDYLYTPGWAVDDLWNGLWGLLRAYNNNVEDLAKLPSRDTGVVDIKNRGDWTGVCPKNAPRRLYDVTAISASNALPNHGGTLIYNRRAGHNNDGPLHDPTGILFVRTADLNGTALRPGVPVEPLILRANAGDCIEVTLRNKLPAVPPDLDGFNTMPMIIDFFNANQVKPSNVVGLHPQMVFLDPTRSYGLNVGWNPPSTVAPNGVFTYQWYAGEMKITDGSGVAVPIEFGATNLVSADPIKHSNKGAVGALIIEPRNSTWTESAKMRAVADIFKPSDITGPEIRFREFVSIFQNDINLRFRGNKPVPNLAEAEDPEDSAQKAINYRTEPIWFRKGFEPDLKLEETREKNFTFALHNVQVFADPETPIFTAKIGQQVRFRVLQPGGHARNNVWTLHGHIWEHEPWINNSTMQGANALSEWTGAQTGVGPSFHFNALPKNGAGGKFKVKGDYLYRTQQSFQFDAGIWGLFRVTPNRRLVVRAYGISASEIKIEWDVDDDLSAASFRVTRRGPLGEDDPSLNAVEDTESKSIAEGFQEVETVDASQRGSTDRGLEADTSYEYIVEALDKEGAVIESSEGGAGSTLEPEIGVIPAFGAPGPLTLFSQGTNFIVIQWGDNSGDELGFRVERSIGSTANFALLANAPANSTSLGDNTIAPGNTYFYRVRAFKTGAESAFSNILEVTTSESTLQGKLTIKSVRLLSREEAEARGL